MTSMQALSGAGRSPGVSAMDILDNIIPYIPKEEEKVEKETLKILGRLSGDEIAPAPVTVSCTCTRVNVLEGHTESVFVELKKKASLDDVKAAWRAFGKDMAELKLPSRRSTSSPSATIRSGRRCASTATRRAGCRRWSAACAPTRCSPTA